MKHCADAQLIFWTVAMYNATRRSKCRYLMTKTEVTYFKNGAFVPLFHR